MNTLILSSLILLLQLATVLSAPAMQRIVINNHEWEVPNEPGWEDVIKDAESVQQRLLSSCTTVAECRRIIEEMRAVFNRYPVSKKYLDESNKQVDDILALIFKWG